MKNEKLRIIKRRWSFRLCQFLFFNFFSLFFYSLQANLLLRCFLLFYYRRKNTKRREENNAKRKRAIFRCNEVFEPLFLFFFTLANDLKWWNNVKTCFFYTFLVRSESYEYHTEETFNSLWLKMKSSFLLLLFLYNIFFISYFILNTRENCNIWDYCSTAHLV